MQTIVDQVEKWLNSVVIDLNLCPFAKAEYLRNKVRFNASSANTEEEVVRDLLIELSLLNKRPDIETTLLILPTALSDFLTFNDFQGFAETLLEEMKLDGVFQLASFHPQYQFAETGVDDVENYTNRAPYPILHILRAASLEQAIAQHPDTKQIPLDNIALMQKLGVAHMSALLAACAAVED